MTNLTNLAYHYIHDLVKNTCDLCGRVIGPAHLKRHRGSRPCRARQIENRMAERGLYPLPNLNHQWALKKSGIRYERFPGHGKSQYRREQLWLRGGVRPPPEYFDSYLYEDLGDRLFVEEWARDLLSGPARIDGIVAVLRNVDKRGPEFKRALMTTKALGGVRAVDLMLAAEGIWPPLPNEEEKPWKRRK